MQRPDCGRKESVLLGPTPGTGWADAELLSRFNAEQIMGMPALARELLVTPSPSSPHQFAVIAFVGLLDSYCRREGVGALCISPADIQLAPESIMQPDVFVIPQAVMPDNDVLRWPSVTGLLLAIEVLSPSTQRQDRVLKRDFYLAHNVEDYWVVDLDARVVERWTPQQARPEVHRDTIEWRPAGATAPLVIDLPEFFVRGARLPRII